MSLLATIDGFLAQADELNQPELRGWTPEMCGWLRELEAARSVDARGLYSRPVVDADITIRIGKLQALLARAEVIGIVDESGEVQVYELEETHPSAHVG